MRRDASEHSAKQSALELHEHVNRRVLETARRVARSLAEAVGETDAERVRKEVERGMRERWFDPPLPPIRSWDFLGAVFRGDEWERVRFRPSEYPGSKNRYISVWRLREKQE